MPQRRARARCAVFFFLPLTWVSEQKSPSGKHHRATNQWLANQRLSKSTAVPTEGPSESFLGSWCQHNKLHKQEPKHPTHHRRGVDREKATLSRRLDLPRRQPSFFARRHSFYPPLFQKQVWVVIGVHHVSGLLHNLLEKKHERCVQTKWRNIICELIICNSKKVINNVLLWVFVLTRQE